MQVSCKGVLEISTCFLFIKKKELSSLFKFFSIIILTLVLYTSNCILDIKMIDPVIFYLDTS